MFKFFKKKKISPTDKARRILLESGWLEKYYYTYKVLSSCDTSNNVKTTINARRWAIDVLDEYHHKLERDYPCTEEIKRAIDRMVFDYTEVLYDIHYASMKKIVDNITEETKKDDSSEI